VDPDEDGEDEVVESVTPSLDTLDGGQHEDNLLKE
jgi:hypothetical protein